ncbi:MAG: LacI family DNA-binding transcriptional regulator [Phycisphaerales bacterium]
MAKKLQPASSGRVPSSIQDVARAAKVSIATVSRVINSPNLVSSETRDRVNTEITRLGYSPNPFAKGLITKASRVLGFALPDIHGEFYSGLLQGANARARELGYHLLVSAESRADALRDGQKALGFGIIDGLAIMITEPSTAIWREARATCLPMVLMDTESEEADVDSILVDNAAGTREAVQHLLSATPPERLFFVGGPQENFDTRRRAEAFVATLKEAGAKPQARHLSFGAYSVDWGRRWVEEHFHELKGSAVLAGNDEIALGILQGAQERGLVLPRDLRLVGFDDTRLATIVRPALSSVHVPMAAVGAASIEALAARVEDPTIAKRVVRLPTTLVVRESSRV